MFQRFRAARALRRFSYRTVAVAMVDGGSVQGVLMDAHGDVLVLTQASMQTPDLGTVSLDGLVVLDRRQVRLMQVLDGAYG